MRRQGVDSFVFFIYLKFKIYKVKIYAKAIRS